MTPDPRGRTRDLGEWLFALWAVFAVLALATVELVPGSESVPFHLALALFALAFSVGRWSLRRSVLSLGLFYLAIAALFLRDSLNHDLQWTEATEVPITALLAAGVIWSVSRTDAALALVRAGADRDRQVSHDRERLARLTSHEMRTPLTVVLGFIDLTEASQVPADVRGYLGAMREEVSDLNRVVDRMLRVSHVNQELPMSRIEVLPLLEGVVTRWRAVAPRQWRVDADPAALVASRDRIVASLDTLVENALRYTTAGDVVRLFAREERGWLLLGVADGGRGMSTELRARVDERRPGGTAPRPDEAPEWASTEAWDAEGGTGLGLEIVRRASHLRGGILVADRAPEGGALVAMWVPTLVSEADHAPFFRDDVPGSPPAPADALARLQPGRVPREQAAAEGSDRRPVRPAR